MFSVDNPANLLALKTEITTDPIGMGYVLAINDDATYRITRRLNKPNRNVGGESIDRKIRDLTILEVADVIVQADYAGLNAYGKQWIQMFINRPTDESIRSYRVKLRQLFSPTSATFLAIKALLPKPASRAEVLFGLNTIITNSDVNKSRQS